MWAEIVAEKAVPGIWEARAKGYTPVGIGSNRTEALDDLRKSLGDEIVPWNIEEQLIGLPDDAFANRVLTLLLYVPPGGC